MAPVEAWPRHIRTANLSANNLLITGFLVPYYPWLFNSINYVTIKKNLTVKLPLNKIGTEEVKKATRSTAKSEKLPWYQG
jgi:hypothetical protein